MLTLILCVYIDITLNHTIIQWLLIKWLINELLIKFHVIINKIIY